jgi:hypothetical protein
MLVPHAVTLVCQNIHTVHIFPCKYHTMHLVFFVAELALGIIFLAFLSIFTCCESGWLIPYTSTHNTQPHHQKCHTRQLGSSLASEGSFAVAGSLGAAAAARQRGSVAVATAAWLWWAAWRHWRQHGSAVAVAAAWWQWAARWWQRQLGGSTAAAAAVAAQRRRWQLGSGGSVLAVAAVAAWRRRRQLGGGGSMVVAVVAAWWQ